MKRIVWLSLLLLLGFAMPVYAQQEISLATVQVQFWPEYDRPSVLVIYTLELQEDVELPVTVSVKIPASVGEPHAVAVALDGVLDDTEYTRQADGEFAEIEVFTESRVVYLEYYDDTLARDGRERTYDFSWYGSYPTDEFIVIVQAPPGTSEMSFSKDLGASQQASDGLNYYSQNFGALGPGEDFDLSMSYQRNTDALTVDRTITQNSSGVPVWLWFAAGLGIAAIGAGGWLYWQNSAKRARVVKSKYARKHSGSALRNERSKPGSFCHNCGSRAQSADNFCRNCGEKLRG